jgi:indolepyruvate ferredoxin oxidoreductase alpha subunit
LFSVNAPFNIGATTMGYGLGSAGGAALNSKTADRRTIAIMGDGGFWHNGLTSGVGNAVFNQND